MLNTLLNILYKLSVIGILLNLIIQYLKYFNIDVVEQFKNKKSDHIVISEDTMRKLEDEFKIKLENVESKYDILCSLKNRLKGMNINQVKEYLSSRNYLLGVWSKNSDKKFISKGRVVVICEFEDNLFQDATDIGDFIINKDELPGVCIL